MEALNAEKERLRTTERFTIPGPLVAPASQQIQEITTPTETTAQWEEVTEPEQPEVEHREPAQEQKAPARVQKAPAAGTGLMDKKKLLKLQQRQCHRRHYRREEHKEQTRSPDHTG